MQLLIEAGADINAKSPSGFTPFLLALNSKAPFSFVQLLIEAGADINAQYAQSSTKKSFDTICFRQ